MWSKRQYPALFLLPAMVLFSGFFIIPNMAGLFMAFTDWSAFHPLEPTFNGLRNFKDLFESSIFTISIRNTIIFTVVTSLLKIVLGYMLAVVLHNVVRWTSLYRTLIFAPVVVNQLVIAIIFSALYHPDYGPINQFLRKIGLDGLTRYWLTDIKVAMFSISVMEVWLGVGVVVVIFLAGLQTVPHEYYEAAKVDGAGVVSQFFHITFPLTFYSLTINTILCLIGGTKVFAQVYGLTGGGPADATQVFGTFIFKSFSQGLYGYGAAAGLLFTVVLSLVSFAALRFFKRLEVEY